MYDGLIKNKPARQISQDIYSLTINHAKEKKFVDPNIFNQAQKVLKKIKTALPNKNDLVDTAKLKYPNLEIKDSASAMSLLVFALFDRFSVSKELTSRLNKELNNRVEYDKKNAIDDDIKLNRLAKTPKVFYLSSSHTDCAIDHLPYQQKIYIDESWKDYIVDKNEKALINRYITQHNTMTMQKVMEKPVWFITRPNCRHYFQAIPTDRVLGKESIKNLSKAYKTNRSVGDRAYLQTLKSNKDRKIIGEKRNAELVIEKYMERRLEHQKLYQTYKSVLIKRAIAKDNQLINKWSDYLKSL